MKEQPGKPENNQEKESLETQKKVLDSNDSDRSVNDNSVTDLTDDEKKSTDSEPQQEQTMLKTNELDEIKDRLLRLQAEFQNYKKRVEKEKKDLYVYGCEEFVIDLLPVLDNLERAIHSVEGKDEHVYKGLEMVHRQMTEMMEKHDIKEIEALGQPFDMHRHHAVMMESCDDPEKANTVAEVMQKGYQLKERVLRPSMVKVYQ